MPTTLSYNAPIQRGLENLVRCLERGTAIIHLAQWVERAFLQLEQDENLDAHTVDHLAELLTEAQDQVEEGASPQDTLAQLVKVYRGTSQTATPVEYWAAQRDQLSEEELETELWDDFVDAMELSAEGDDDSMLEWVEEVASNFIRVWNEYQGFSLIDEEITLETKIGHAFLRDGVESWLEALHLMKEGTTSDEDSERVLAAAYRGQRNLVALQQFESSLQQDCLLLAA